MKKFLCIFTSLFILGTGAGSFSAGTAAQLPVLQHYEGIPYISGGIGEDEREAMRSISRDYNLKLVFAIKEGNYLADIAVLIKDAEDKTMLDAVSDGPWFFTRLSPGIYTVTATMTGKAKTQKAQIKPTGQSVLQFYLTE